MLLVDKLSGLPALKDLTLVGSRKFDLQGPLSTQLRAGFLQKMLAALCALERLEKLHLEDWASDLCLRR